MKLAVLLLLLLAACGGPATADQASVDAPAGIVEFGSSEPTTTTSTATSTTVSLVTDTSAPTAGDHRATGPDAALIDFEALWLCEAQRQTFDSPGAVDETLNLRLGETGIARASDRRGA